MRAATRSVTLAALALASLVASGCGADSASAGVAPAPVVTRVIAASDLRFAFDELLDTRFRSDHPECDVQVSYGSSGQAFSQLSEGAPFDLFLSAAHHHSLPFSISSTVFSGNLLLSANTSAIFVTSLFS